MNSFSRQSKNNKNRREFLRNGMVAAGAATLGTGLLASGAPVLAEQEKESSGKLSRGDAAILRCRVGCHSLLEPHCLGLLQVRYIEPTGRSRGSRLRPRTLESLRLPLRVFRCSLFPVQLTRGLRSQEDPYPRLPLPPRPFHFAGILGDSCCSWTAY